MYKTAYGGMGISIRYSCDSKDLREALKHEQHRVISIQRRILPMKDVVLILRVKTIKRILPFAVARGACLWLHIRDCVFISPANL